MRLVIAGFALALAVPALAGAAAAQSPGVGQALAPGEVLLEVNAIGTVTSRADSATMVVPVNATAPTEAEARRQAESAADRIAAAAASAGVAPGDIERHPIMVGPDAAMAAAMEQMQQAAEAARQSRGSRAPVVLRPDAATSPAESAHSEVAIRVHGLDRLVQVRHALQAAGIQEGLPPTYALTDDRAQRTAARAQAIAQAQANAEGYASALGMRVARTLRVTERVGMDLFTTMFSDSGRMRQLMSGMEGRSQEITTTVALGMDFALAPR